ncbi:PH domain-containing protein [Albibacterium bauzanense]|uniref:PH (Pleckstrin Homology) domain-containing protein n=1 Tax=Albibacterium bauzanense TaxID=653929 RepID=A0A4R1M198_9SPHI|nr:PH domain-containing protein [Albibacterium bauzanense]TCK83413.1 PH (Pleckstrin Homology) domain-containing protein [Albibacterium bauzanense]
MNIDRYINEDQDPKTVERILGKLQDMLDSGELVTYIAVQKKPAVTLLPDCIVLTNKRIFLCEATNLGLSTNFEIFNWADLKTITFKEEFFGAKFTIVPTDNENLTVDYIPKVQARKLYQLAKEAMEKQQSQSQVNDKISAVIEDRELNDYQSFKLQPEEEPVIKEDLIKVEEEDELTLKLKKLKTLFDKQLITKDEYESKKLELLSQL